MYIAVLLCCEKFCCFPGTLGVLKIEIITGNHENFSENEGEDVKPRNIFIAKQKQYCICMLKFERFH